MSENITSVKKVFKGVNEEKELSKKEDELLKFILDNPDSKLKAAYLLGRKVHSIDIWEFIPTEKEQKIIEAFRKLKEHGEGSIVIHVEDGKVHLALNLEEHKEL